MHLPTFHKIFAISALIVYHVFVMGIFGCSTNHEILKYQSDLKRPPHNLIPGLEPEEAPEQIIITVTGKGLEPRRGTSQQKQLLAERAAIMDGYRKLSERLAGTIVNVYSESEDNNITKDKVVAETNAYLKGAQVREIKHEDGYTTALVRVYISPREIKYYHGNKMSRTIIGALTGAAVGSAVGAGAGYVTGQSLSTITDALTIGAGAGAIGGGLAASH